MSWTKRDIVEDAFGDASLSPNGRNLTPDELQSAMWKLDNMMAGWTEDGIVFTPVYPQPATKTGGSLSSETNAPTYANHAMAINLARLMSWGYGKVLATDLKGEANLAYNVLLGRYMVIPEISLQGMIRGAGDKRRPFRPFLGDTTT